MPALPTAPASAGARGMPPADATCFHCGLPNPPGRRWEALVRGATRRFCCAGCLAVAQTIHAAGLEGFYAARTATLARPVEAVDDEWTRHDEAAHAAGLVRTLPEGRCEASLLLEGLTCGACVWLIESWLARQPGVEAVRVNFATRRARVAWRADATRLADVLRAVAAVGYRAHPYDPAKREALARREKRALLLRMSVALLMMMQVMMLAVPTYVSDDGVAPEHQALLDWASFTLTLPVLFYAALPFFRGALRDLGMRRLGMDVPVALGLAAAFAASAWSTLGGGGPVYYDSVTMFVALLLVARYVELVARHHAGEAIEGVARARPAVAERFACWPGDERAETVAAASLQPGDHVLVRPGTSVPADGEVVDGTSHVEEAVLTGESWPRAKRAGDPVLAGAVNREGALVVRVTAAGEATRLAAVLRLVERASTERPRVARIADRVAAWFVGALLLLALGTAVVWSQVDAGRALAVTFAVLVVSCPCALSLATPAALAAAAGALSRRQVVLANADALEALARVTHVVFDKTGTLTLGEVRVQAVAASGGRDEGALLALAAALERRSEHPIAAAIDRAAPAQRPFARDVRALPGQGLEGAVDGACYRIGRASFVEALSGPAPAELRAFVDAAHASSTVVLLGDANGVLGAIALGDTPRADAATAVASLRALGVEPILMSGDRQQAAHAAGAALGIRDARGDLTPGQKRDAIVALQAAGAVVAMVGDGVNDAPGLAQAQVSVSLGSATPLAQWTADVVILSDAIARVGEAIVHARRTLAVVRQNLGWASVYNAIAIPAAALGFVTPLLAAVGMSVSSLVVVGNALRVARVKADDVRAPEGPAQAARAHHAQGL
ncbi:MAG TPA: heavy metal translocating P-type ATPase [Casimicrobiaceae bacterium]|nr:heavy metal translocating P-type ATPase [Casimicrobiaceae bacterium]